VADEALSSQQIANPDFGGSPFEPGSYLPTVSSDTKLGQPIPSGRFIDPRYPSGASEKRAAQLYGEDGFYSDPVKYMEANATELNSEQSLVDKGMSLMERLFNYEDQSDLEVLGVNLSAVESVWDGFIKQLVGIEDAKNLGLAALVSAAPGGVQTYSFDDLSDGNSFGDIISGNAGEINAPSTGQTIIASVGIEAKRIREGKTRAADVLLMNPFTAPFILAALKAESSPLQADGFDILDDEMREEAFSEGWEKWTSGVTDAGLVFADPLIGVGVVAKVMKLGALGNPGGKKFGGEFGGMSDQFIKDLDEAVDGSSGIDFVDSEVARRSNPEVKVVGGELVTVPGITAGEAIAPSIRPKTTPIEGDVPVKLEKKSPIAKFIWDLHRTDKNGDRVMTHAILSKDKSLRQNTNRTTVVNLLMKSKSPAESVLILKAMSGTKGAIEQLKLLSPDTANQTRLARRAYANHASVWEQSKKAEIIASFDDQANNIRQSLNGIKEQIDTYKRDVVDTEGSNYPSGASTAGTQMVPGEGTALQNLRNQENVYNQTLNEIDELKDMVENGTSADDLDAASAFYNPDKAKVLFSDIMSQDDAITKEALQAITDTGMSQRMFLPSKNNSYSRMVMKSRERTRNAAYKYASEGTDILPRARFVTSADGSATKIRQWLPTAGSTSSELFEKSGRFARNIRVWRWINAENPAGYISWKSTGAIGAEKEWDATLDFDFFKGDPKTFTRTKDEAGNLLPEPEVKSFGGAARKDELFAKFYQATNGGDAPSVLQKIEDTILEEMMTFYGFSSTPIKEITALARKNKNANLDSVSKLGYFTAREAGEEAPTVQTVAFLESQMQTGTYMMNFKEFEKVLQKKLASANGNTWRTVINNTGNIPSKVTSGYEIFNSLWRPATLLRLSYTQRNVFEGMLRAMAYEASLAPLFWPAVAAYKGVSTKAGKRRAKSGVRQAQKAYDIESGGYKALRNEQIVAQNRVNRINTAEKIMSKNNVGEPEYVVYLKSNPDTKKFDDVPMGRSVTDDEYKGIKEQLDRNLEATKGKADASLSQYESQIYNTRFGKWRRKNLKEADAVLEQKELQRQMLDTTDFTGETDGLAEATLDSSRKRYELENAADLEIAMLQMQINALRYDPAAGMSMFADQAARQRRIGSGTSMSPDNVLRGDAFTGPLSGINASLMSADNTVTAQLSLAMNRNYNFYADAVRQQNVPITYLVNPKAYAVGITENINVASSSWVVRELVLSDWDLDYVYRTMTSTPAGKQFMVDLRLAQSTNIGANKARYAPGEAYTRMGDEGNYEPNVGKDSPVSKLTLKQRKALRKFTEGDNVESVRVTDPEVAQNYIMETANIIIRQFSDNPDLLELLKQQSLKKKMNPQTVSGQPAILNRVGQADPIDKNVENILNSLTRQQKEGLGPTFGSGEIIETTDKVREQYRKTIKRLFQILGSIPEDYVTRGPFYNNRFKETRNMLIDSYLSRTGQKARGKKVKPLKTKSGADIPNSLETPQFDIPAGELGRITAQAHKQALQETREWMYTIERRTNLGKYGEWIWPFISAQQNSMTVAGKLLYKDPALGPAIVDIWKFPERLGVEDDEGNLTMPMPSEWIQEMFDDPDIPFLGGILDEFDMITIPKNGLNVGMPESGFGIIPRPMPLVQVAASELMKQGMFSTEAPEGLKSVLGEEDAKIYWGLLKDYIYGEEQGASDKFASYNKVIPAYAQKFLYSKQELSAQYGYAYKTHLDTQMLRFKGGERDEPPTIDEINKRTTNGLLFQMLGNQGIPTPFTPYPIITRPSISGPLSAITDYYRELQASDSLNASMNLSSQLGDWAVPVAMGKVNKNVGGASSTPEAISDIGTLDDLIRESTTLVGPNDLNVLGMLVNNRIPNEKYEDGSYKKQEFDSSSYNVLKSKDIAGTSTEWIEGLSPEEAALERERVAGWAKWRSAIDQLDAQMFSAGLTSYMQVAAKPYKDAKDRLKANMFANPDYAGWVIDYQDTGGTKTQSAIRVLDNAVQDPGFRDLLLGDDKEKLLSTMVNYLQTRKLLVAALADTGKGINAEGNERFKIMWDASRLAFRNGNQRWAEIESLYLSADVDLPNVGNWQDQLEGAVR
jgi:hypothetical protein